ncbi:malate:quinone oxidoreductase [Staphylococcus gallinarum]|uniref:malate dehydrogenase (quinone) n=1 Tax=Staphylococcus gallinarum TaxID=1293 RepID=A0A380FMA3_STAGA|nr:malate:quinone oxidoreductase [Staphylococcus gallinarum]
MFKGIEYTEDHEKLKEWIPLMMDGRNPEEKVAASKIDEGTDVNFGELTRKMAKNLNEHDNAEIFYKHEVQDFNRRKDGKWEVKVKDLNTKKVETYITDYVFIGAGGHAIPLLQKNRYP